MALMKVRILGAGEATDPKFGNNACLLFGDGIPAVLFDCGYQIPERFWNFGLGHERLDAVYLTHLHADHSFGMVPLLLRYAEERRRKPLSVFGPRGTEAFLSKLLDLGYPGVRHRLSYRLRFREVEEASRFRFRNLRFECARSVHSVPNFSVKVTGPDGTSLAVSGDGALSDASRTLFYEVDLLLCEVFSSRPPNPAPQKRRKTKAPSHGNLDELLEFVRSSRIKRVGVTHCAREERTKVERRVRRLQSNRWFVARPGTTLDITR